MSLEFLAFMLPFILAATGLAWLVFWMIWRWRGKTRPIMAGSICLVLGLAIALVPVAFFGVRYSEPSHGVILIVPTWGPLLLGIAAFVVGLFKGRRGAVSNLKKLREIILDDPAQKDDLK